MHKNLGPWPSLWRFPVRAKKKVFGKWAGQGSLWIFYWCCCSMIPESGTKSTRFAHGILIFQPHWAGSLLAGWLWPCMQVTDLSALYLLANNIWLWQEDALHVFLLMGKEYRISRSIRAQWFFQQFNSTLPHPKPHKELVSCLSSLSSFYKFQNTRCLYFPQDSLMWKSYMYM